MLLFFFLTILFAASGMANEAAGKWQLLFFYNLYHYQVDALGLSGSLMAPGCTQKGIVCDLESFVKEVSKVKREPPRDANGKVIPQPKGQKPTILSIPDFSTVDWNGIGDGATFNQDKFNSEMDKVGFKGGIINSKLYKGWAATKDSYATVMDKAQSIAEDAQKKLKADGKPISNDRYTALQKALDIHANARRYDQANRLVTTFNDYAKGKGLTVVMKGEEISRPPVPSYKQIDADKTVKANGLTGTGADNVRDWVANENKAGDSKTHVDAISKASVIQQKLAAACGKSS
ncbi:hypothetical protein VE00_11105 [Pseudogymnoascus sp. WSF 3629]|nr:hypothetical protein VE00_11105 [Pseudogymnoascus sp. WSF 3629]